MDKRYSHADFEQKIYSQWEKSKSFSPTTDKKAETFTIMMPPPNANDPLHIGHAMFVALEDIMIRYNRMLGKASLWLPGTDHAGIETQFVFEKKLSKKKQSRFDFDRETLYQMIWDYVQENSDVAVKQLKALGASADWDRFKFMLDPKLVETVLETFQKLHHEDLIYRDLRLVNYCTKCGTAFSELEVKHVEQTDSLYYMKYGPFTLATVRPETKFGDTAVAVNPNDERYQEYIGKEIEVKGLLGTFKMKVITDDYVDPEFGTGVVKITPAHDPNDFDVWLRHKDEIPGPKQVIDFNGKLNHLTGPYQGLKVLPAREQIAQDLEKEGLLEKVDTNYTHNVSTCYRCGRILEPLPMPQFFIKVKPLTEPVLRGLKEKDIVVHGSGHDKILKHWLENLKDWNISRQIVWGIRMPVWYDTSLEENQNIEVLFVNKKQEKIRGELKDLLKEYDLDEIRTGLQTLRAPVEAKYVISPTLPDKNFIQETDTFDTWFSSAQWPFTTLMNGKKGDFDRFFPTQVMETGYDILPFWVMRMLMMGKFATGKFPFNTVYLHGLIRDQKGQKMSKSKGNVINPLDVIEKYGADALRMSLVIRSTAGQDKNVGEQDIRAMRNFTNKIWNAARFIVVNLEESSPSSAKGDTDFLNKLEETVNTITRQLDSYKIGLAAETTYNEFWHWFCDEAIEQAKNGDISQQALMTGLVSFLKLLHPFVPFVTEAVYQELLNNSALKKAYPKLLESEQLIVSQWPSKELS